MSARDSQLKVLLRIVKNSDEPGTLAYTFHYLTGLVLAVYLFLHLWTLSSSTISPSAFDAKLGTFNQPLFLALDAALLAAASFHTFNGIRIILFDLGIGVKRQKFSFILAAVLTGIIAALAAELLLPLFFGRG